MLLKGNVMIGTTKGTKEEIRATFDGTDEFRVTMEQETLVGPHLVALPGSWIDGLSVFHGPLIYHNIQFPSDGGVHFNGCAFSHDGSDKPENPYYREECVEYLLMQTDFQNLRL